VPGGTLVVSRDVSGFPFYKKQLEAFGFYDVFFAEEESNELNMFITERKPRLVLVGSRFYEAATSLMIKRLLKRFSYLNIAVINIKGYPVKSAPFFIWRGANSYVDFGEGWDEFKFGMEEVRKGNTYISPAVKKIIDSVEWPQLNDKACKRQMEVLIFLCNGIKPEEIGEMLHVKKRTVDWHIEELFKVFDVDNREELISIAFCTKTVTEDDISFYDRKEKRKLLPEWAEVKQKIARRAV
jgi:DNA-binding NarL/FixJ family response regulator